MRTGSLNKRITVQSYTPTGNAIGEPIKSWSTYATRWAAIEPLLGREYWAAQQVVAENSVRFRLRYDATTAAITPKMRVSYDGRLFDIQSVVNVREQNIEIVLMTVEVRDD